MLSGRVRQPVGARLESVATLPWALSAKRGGVGHESDIDIETAGLWRSATPADGRALSLSPRFDRVRQDGYIFDNATLASWPPYEQGGTSKTTMGSFLSSPMIEKDSTDGEIDSHRFGSSAMQGWRKGMEVRLSVVPCAVYPSA